MFVGVHTHPPHKRLRVSLRINLLCSPGLRSPSPWAAFIITMTTLQNLNRNITQTIERYVEFDDENRRERVENAKCIRELCFVNGVRSIEYVEFYYIKLREKDG